MCMRAYAFSQDVGDICLSSGSASAPVASGPHERAAAAAGAEGGGEGVADIPAVEASAEA